MCYFRAHATFSRNNVFENILGLVSKIKKCFVLFFFYFYSQSSRLNTISPLLWDLVLTVRTLLIVYENVCWPDFKKLLNNLYIKPPLSLSRYLISYYRRWYLSPRLGRIFFFLYFFGEVTFGSFRFTLYIIIVWKARLITYIIFRRRYKLPFWARMNFLTIFYANWVTTLHQFQLMSKV